MTIKIEKTDHVVHFWYAEDLDGNNFLMILCKKPTCWRLDWRFRYVKGEKVFGSKDKKVFYHALAGLQVPESQAIGEAQETFELTKEQFCMKRISQRVNGGPEVFHKIFNKFSWVHSKVEPR